MFSAASVIIVWAIDSRTSAVAALLRCQPHGMRPDSKHNSECEPAETINSQSFLRNVHCDVSISIYPNWFPACRKQKSSNHASERNTMISGFFLLFIWFVFGVLSICERFIYVSFVCPRLDPATHISLSSVNDCVRSFSKFPRLPFTLWRTYACVHVHSERDREKWMPRRRRICMSFVFSVQSTVNGVLPYPNEYH